MSQPSFTRRMTADVRQVLGSLSQSPGSARRVAVPAEARALSMLAHVDYADAFTVPAHGPERTPEQWTRAVLEDAPLTAQRFLHRLLSAVGLQLGPIGADGFIVGWKMHRSTAEYVLLGTQGPRIGLRAELLFRPERQRLLWATFVQQDNVTARAAWAGMGVLHRRVVPYLLGRATSSR